MLTCMDGSSNMTFNVHLCLHLAKCVYDWGPIWTHSAFIYESYQGDLLKTIQSAQSIPHQICKTYLYKMRSYMAAKHMANAPTQCQNFYAELTTPPLASSSFKYSEDVTLLTLKNMKLSAEEILAFNRVKIHFKTNLTTCAKKVVIRGEIFHSKDGTREIKRNSYTVIIDNNQFCLVKGFVYVEGKCYALVQYLSKQMMCYLPAMNLKM